ncbi:hypothetical protein FisN_26Lh094 [Fistulifera solaris]|uniref:Uncharacterized protein n=1 Tax=Fistulifera solaris TaxID=1519565 RepID=A0A1Z5KCK0_FISSO|nr:hypothetical protein FisN_26Lh094 [Fistulifera solaris]|eukprot:GAX24024.1 hypothetical protein FisN_26Lh094 [Fistulifera solaris]
MTVEMELRDASKDYPAGSSKLETSYSSDGSPSSRRAVRFENVQEESESVVRREKGFSPTETDHHAAYLKTLRELSTEKQKRRRKEKNMLKLAQELGNRTEQVAEREKQLKALRLEIDVLKKKLFEATNEKSEERDETGNVECNERQSTQTDVSRLEKELHEKTNELTIVQLDIAERSKALEMQQAELSKKAEALRVTEAELMRERDEISELRQHLEELKGECVKHTQERNDEMKVLETDLTAKKDLVMTQSASVSLQNAKAEIVELRDTLKLTQASLIKSDETITSHKDLLSSLNLQVVQLNEHIADMQTDLEKERAEVERLSKRSIELEDEKASLRQDLDEATNDMMFLKANVLVKERLLQDMREELRLKESESTATAQTNTESLRVLQEQCQSKDARLDAVMLELAHERSAFKAVEEQRLLLEDECKAIRIAKDLSRQKNDKLQDELKALKALAMVEELTENHFLVRSILDDKTNEGVKVSAVNSSEQETKETLNVEDAARIELLEASRQRLLDDCNFIRLSLTKLEDEVKGLLLEFDSDKKLFAGVESSIKAQHMEATLVREELMGCKIEIQGMADDDTCCDNGSAGAERLIATLDKIVSGMLANVGVITQTIEFVSELKFTVERLQHDMKDRDKKIAELENELKRFASRDAVVPEGNSIKVIAFNNDLEPNILKEEARQSLLSAFASFNSVLSTLSEPSSEKLTRAVDKLQATCGDINSQIFLRLESEVALALKMKVARDKAMQALGQNNKNMEETAMNMEKNLATIKQEHSKKIEDLKIKLAQETQSKDDAKREHDAALRSVENKYVSTVENLGKKSDELLTDFEFDMQGRIDKLESKLDKKAARIRTLQRLLTHKIHPHRPETHTPWLFWFSMLLVIFALPIFVMLGTEDRQWFCASSPPWEHDQSNKVQPWQQWWSSFNKVQTPSSHPWWKWENNAHLDWIEAKICRAHNY